MPGQNGTTETDEHTTATTTINCSINRKTIILRLREFCHRTGRKVKDESTPCQQAGGAEVWLKSFLTTALDGGTWPSSRAGRLTPWKEPWYLFGRFGEGKIFCPLRGSNPGTTSP